MILAAASDTSLAPHLFWLASRAAGAVAIAMVTLSVILGLMQGGRLPLGMKPRDITRIHEITALAGIAAIVAHGALLLGDSWLNPSLGELLIPFKLDYRSLYTGLGVIGAWVVVLLGLSYYARDQIGVRRWKTIHRFTIVGWALSAVHVLGAGSDAGSTWLKVPMVASIGVVAALFILRVAGSREVSWPAPDPARRRAPEATPSMPPARPTPARAAHR